MATGWVKSLQCKSRAFEDVYHPSPKPLNLILPTSGCRKSYQSLKDVVENTPKKPKKRHPIPPPQSPSPRPGSTPKPRTRAPACPPARTRSGPFFPTLTELPEGHSSRNVVEIIFRTSWCPKSIPGRIEMMFKVQNLPKTVSRFEEYREMVKSRAGGAGPGSRKEENARCVADGNELMRFHCVGPTNGEVYDAGGLCTFSAGKGGAIRTFSGSGGAHETAGGGKGRRAMLVCRVIAGRVCKGVDSFLEGGAVGGGGFDSVNGENGALVVFDSRALLPCFLIIYTT
ncbi:uncharacterized protein LOC131248332 [Magnolia sinica]|uniref:uncharacterized protein LOC131248332 n=1 Tax=Magnolia sinica TaxID=86752 RepID=UPI002659E632|nr:uncharacterized protein LOC131248332 [Magnolia sinica]